jgi:hypothetical protein
MESQKDLDAMLDAQRAQYHEFKRRNGLAIDAAVIGGYDAGICWAQSCRDTRKIKRAAIAHELLDRMGDECDERIVEIELALCEERLEDRDAVMEEYGDHFGVFVREMLHGAADWFANIEPEPESEAPPVASPTFDDRHRQFIRDQEQDFANEDD